ncbi:LPXTG cell wall anchor domain-containing protein [Catellatospora tritici]|uniref:LPXTG cell wall anchor domain-containing protein n=1 Tax=Catellatospora tritici TaxID=2851566 RepID=UPI001C2DB152|nr:LPXTG cell wall anchor domain-containing protein [Catellatospora tritici]MBV1855398.1 LPXTG cell wall anchor domain-containing protein [Catellatospora tritici]
MKIRTALAAGASALLCAGIAAAGSPAFAADGSDLSVKIASSNITVDTPVKWFRLDLSNIGSASADSVQLKLDFSGLDTTRVAVDMDQFVPGCDVTGKVAFCADGPEFLPNESLTQFVLLESKGATGAAGSFTAEFTSAAGGDVNPANNTATVNVSVTDHAVDLQSVALDLVADYTDAGKAVGLTPGDTAPLAWWISNEGDTFVKGVNFTITLPPYVRFTDVYDICQVNDDWIQVLTCSDPDAIIPPGGGVYLPGEPLIVEADQYFFDGPAILPGGLVSAQAIQMVGDVPNWDDILPADGFETVDELTDEQLQQLIEDMLDKVLDNADEAVEAIEADSGDNDASFAAHIAAPPPADQVVTATPAQGKVGDVVSVTIKVSNIGKSSTGPMIDVHAPAGTSFVVPDPADRPQVGSCIDLSGGEPWAFDGWTDIRCGWESELQAGRSLSMKVLLRIEEDKVGNDGLVTASTVVGKDVNPANDKAKLVIKVLAGGTGGGLPVTGTNVTVIAASGLAAVALGVVLFLVARRRRATLVEDTRA